MEELSMTDELWAALTDAEKEAWQQVQTTLGSPGFAMIKRDLTEVGDAISQKVFHAENWDQYVFMRGQLDTLRMLLNLENRVLVQLNQSVAERATDLEVEGEPVEVEAFA